jgi:opacity protein-like surface antigen
MKHLISSLALSALLLPACAFAQWQVAADAGLRYVRNTESGVDGSQMVREYGWLPGVGATAGYATGDWRIAMAGEIYGGNIAYNGQLQSGARFDSNTDTTQSRIRFELGRQVTDALQLLAGIEYDYWKRDIRGTANVAGLQEQYNSWRLLAGAKGRVAQWDAGTLHLQGLLVFSEPEHLTVRFDQQLFDDANFSTKSAVGLRFGAGFQPTALPNFSVLAELEWIDIGRSDNAVLRRNGVPVGTVTQPQHERTAFGVRAVYRF